MRDYIGPEKAVQGREWGALHGGYFSDPEIARPLIDTAQGILEKSPADVIVDLGGGTGFLLSQLASRGMGAHVALVDVDCSETQLASTGAKRISRVCASIDTFRRRDIAAGKRRIFFMMRSNAAKSARSARARR